MLLGCRRILKIRMSDRVLDPLKHGKMAYMLGKAVVIFVILKHPVCHLEFRGVGSI